MPPPPRPSSASPRRSSTRRRQRAQALWALLCLAAAPAAAGLSRWALSALEVPNGLAFGALIGLMAAMALGFVWVRPATRWNLLGLAIVLGAFTGVTAHALVAPSGRIERADPNRQVAARVFRLAQALEHHANRADLAKGSWKYPANAEFIPFVQALGLPEDPLLSPWGDVPQAVRVPAGGATALPTATELAADALLPSLQTRLGRGAIPTTGDFTVRTFGALIYDHDPATDSFVLYGVGRQFEEAVLVAVVRSQR